MGTESGVGFGPVLRQLRMATGLSQEALAERAGLSPDGIAALERGRRTRPRAFTVGVLADALALGPADRALLVSAATSQARPGDLLGRPLPVWLTSFVGRQQELAEVERWLGRVRLLTLTGPGGTGKTRLALAAAERHAGACWFAGLDVCAGPEQVVRAMADAVGTREIPGTPLAESLLERAAGLDGLLVLDNCEHVADAVAALAYDLLRASPRLRVLATSREVLRVPGEMTWPVPALPAVDAERLFTERAALTRPGFAAAPDHADAIARVCRLLDGLPLAIELAAARSGTLTPAQLASRLDDAFAVLTTSARTAAPRHQTLRAAVDWSYQLLEPDEQRLFAWLSVFAGGFDLDAAEAAWGGPVPAWLAALVDRSLVMAEPGIGAMRYRMLEVLRQYGQARLAESGEEDQARRRHAQHYVRLAQRVPAVLWDDADQRRWLPLCRAERANFDAALRWAAGQAGEAGQIGVELTCALAPFWEAEGSISDGLTRLEAALPSARGTLRIRVLDKACRFAFRQADYALAAARKQESADLKCAEGDEQGMAHRLSELGLYRVCQGEPGTGREALEQALGILTRYDDARGIVAANIYLGLAALLNDEVAEAERRFLAGVAFWTAEGDQPRSVISQSALLMVLLEKGNLAGARTIAADMLAVVAGPLLGMPEDAGWLWSAMLLAEAEGRDPAALRLLGAIGAWSQRGHRWIEPLRRRYQPVTDRLLERTDPRVTVVLMTEGAAMSPPELAARALEGGG